MRWFLRIRPACGTVRGMVDTELLVQALRDKGHVVEHAHRIPENAGAYELSVDGTVLTLEQARALLENAV